MCVVKTLFTKNAVCSWPRDRRGKSVMYYCLILFWCHLALFTIMLPGETRLPDESLILFDIVCCSLTICWYMLILLCVKLCRYVMICWYVDIFEFMFFVKENIFLKITYYCLKVYDVIWHNLLLYSLGKPAFLAKDSYEFILFKLFVVIRRSVDMFWYYVHPSNAMLILAGGEGGKSGGRTVRPHIIFFPSPRSPSSARR